MQEPPCHPLRGNIKLVDGSRQKVLVKEVSTNTDYTSWLLDHTNEEVQGKVESSPTSDDTA